MQKTPLPLNESGAKFCKKTVTADLGDRVSSLHHDRILPLTEPVFRDPFTIPDLPKTALDMEADTRRINRQNIHKQTPVPFLLAFSAEMIKEMGAQT